MRERPILFTAEMVRAIQDGRKTQTRRIIRHYRWVYDNGDISCRREIYHSAPIDAQEMRMMMLGGPYGVVGDRLWVREAWAAKWDSASATVSDLLEEIAYRADGDTAFRNVWRPSIHMPRWASRITLEITDVRVQRVQDISKEDAIAESSTDEFSYRLIWDSIHGKKRGAAWSDNPWCWAITFKRVEQEAQP
jgi:hypothetical protein